MRSWLYLAAAILCEVIGTSSMKLAHHYDPFISHLFMYFMIGLSYFFLSLAVKKVPVGVAYALWEGIGIVIITIISVSFFNEHINSLKSTGLTLIIMGIILIKSGSGSKKDVIAPAPKKIKEA